jgi:DNA-binding SARP family transcriptional activator
MIELRTLGVVDLRDAHGAECRTVLAQPKRVALLVYLAVAQPRGFQRRDVLLALFWPELDQQHARGALRKAVYSVRHDLGPGTLLGRGDEELGVSEGALWCDTVAFERAIATHGFADALDLYRGEFLTGFFIGGAPDFERWVEQERSRLRAEAARAAWALAEQAASEHEPVGAVTWARRALTFSPSDEGAVRRLVTLCYRVGDRAAALHAYAEFEARLLAEYGVRPSAETRELIEAVRMSRQIG